MSLTVWFLSYAMGVLFCLWLIRWGGADLLEGMFPFGFFRPRWSADGIKVFGWCALVASTIGFIVGVFWPDFRF